MWWVDFGGVECVVKPSIISRNFFGGRYVLGGLGAGG